MSADSESLAQVRRLLPALRVAWDVEQVNLTVTHLEVSVRQDQAGDIPHLLHNIPILLTVLKDEMESEAA